MPKNYPDGLPESGFLRANDLIRPRGPIPMSISQLHVLIKKKEITRIKLSARVTVFNVAEIREKLLSPIQSAEHSEAADTAGAASKI